MPAAVTSCAREQIILGFLLRTGWGGGRGRAIMPQTRTQRLERVTQLGKAE